MSDFLEGRIIATATPGRFFGAGEDRVTTITSEESQSEHKQPLVVTVQSYPHVTSRLSLCGVFEREHFRFHDQQYRQSRCPQYSGGITDGVPLTGRNCSLCPCPARFNNIELTRYEFDRLVPDRRAALTGDDGEPRSYSERSAPDGWCSPAPTVTGIPRAMTEGNRRGCVDRLSVPRSPDHTPADSLQSGICLVSDRTELFSVRTNRA